MILLMTTLSLHIVELASNYMHYGVKKGRWAHVNVKLHFFYFSPDLSWELRVDCSSQ